MLINTIAEKLNMSINFQYYSSINNLGDLFVSNDHQIDGTGMLNDLFSNNIDIAVGNIVISDRVYRNIAVSTPYTVVNGAKSSHYSLFLTLDFIVVLGSSNMDPSRTTISFQITIFPIYLQCQNYFVFYIHVLDLPLCSISGDQSLSQVIQWRMFQISNIPWDMHYFFRHVYRLNGRYLSKNDTNEIFHVHVVVLHIPSKYVLWINTNLVFCCGTIWSIIENDWGPACLGNGTGYWQTNSRLF